ncbi:cbhB, partial [Symbiodinium sp. KB8]
LPLCAAQQAGMLKTEGNPTMALKQCTKAEGCTTKEHKLVLDANWRWIHTTDGYKNCYTGNTWDSSICSDPDACAQGCALEAVDAAQYESIYGITAVPGGVKLNFVTGSNVGSRLFLLEDDDTYKLFKLKNREFALDVDSSTVECGMNGAMYFIEMAADGGKGLGYNAAGAKYGTGYCDAQCPHDVKFIGGSANTKDWKPHPKDFSNTIGLGHYGACCAEMDIWEANNMATAYTPHPCNIDVPGQYVCEGTDCGDNDSGERYDGLCDKDGCDINPFRNGNTSFYGKGSDFAVDSSRPMTVVTQFLTTDGTDEGDLSEIRRFYVQDGRAIASPPITILPKTPDSITDEMCEDIKDLFDNKNDYQEKGGSKAMGESLDRGHVAAFSLWDDIDVHMMWLDSCYPEDKPCSDPGVHRGMCPGGEESAPQNVRRKHTFGHVIFANAAVGEIGTTQSVYPGSPVTSPPSTTATMPTETTTTTELTATMPTETSTTTQLTTTGISRSDWEPVDGGEGRACRGASRSDNKPQYYKVVRGIASLEDCQMTCAATAGCRGVEFSRQRCEVWLRAEGIEATLALPGFVCMRYGGPVATTTTPMMGTWPPVDGGDGRACRGASRSDNSADYYTVLPGLVNLDTCKARCQITNGCQGVEFSIGRCEIWTRPGGIQASIALQGFTCLGYQSAAVSTMPPSTATTTATASTSEPPATTTASAACVGAWQQCGGRNHAGATCCVEGYLCVMDNEWYSQCQPTPMPAFAQAAAQKRGSRRQKFLGPSFMQSKAKAWKGASQPPLEKWEL